MDKPELYNGYDELSSYLKEQKNLSYRGFLLLHQDVIVHSSPILDNWNRMDAVWAKRYLKEAKELYPNDFADIREKVKFERDGNGLSAYWKKVINERKKVSIIYHAISDNS
ncbi:uncharacterized protein OCT59_008312 [Rhizophagus irregularis]|uniref:uncharacterized protein n=1 Tax=Rhizophagus irregularis TaxID=588596 RepID=UPI001A0D99C5|nr:hypothetical protein OCT59_008312 [Rhizophagus irregularis]GBC42527.2 hypothetical protein GLOIN_2v1482691 [Rhizophagus irregularis DAOM 181602=DAOM 197198]